MRGPLLWAGWLLATGYLASATGSCRQRCCPGRNNTCWAPGAPRAPCYCDSYCQRTGDCCQDYLAVCRRAAVGCAVGPWGPWSRCSSRCGVGSRARSRQVTVLPGTEGIPVRTSSSAAAAWGSTDLRHSQRGSQDTPQLLQPGLQRTLAKSGAAAAGGALWLLRLFPPDAGGSPCRGRAWSRGLHRDKQVCVQCWGNLPHRRPHCAGHGLQGARTFWVAASVVGCQGSWVQEGLQEGCVCSPPALIFM